MFSSLYTLGLLSNILLAAATVIVLNLGIPSWLLILRAINYRASTSSILYREGVGVIVLLLLLGIVVGVPILTKVNVLVKRPCTFLNSQAISI